MALLSGMGVKLPLKDSISRSTRSRTQSTDSVSEKMELSLSLELEEESSLEEEGPRVKDRGDFRRRERPRGIGSVEKEGSAEGGKLFSGL